MGSKKPAHAPVIDPGPTTRVFKHWFIMCMSRHTRGGHGTHEEVRGQLTFVPALLLLYGSWELNSGHQAWLQAPLLSKPSYRPQSYFLFSVDPSLSSDAFRLVYPLSHTLIS